MLPLVEKPQSIHLFVNRDKEPIMRLLSTGSSSSRRRWLAFVCFLCLLAAVPAATALAQQGQQTEAATKVIIGPKPNYDLASQWTAQKAGRLVFDTSVTPRWLESGDRFWYAFQTRDGRKFYLVDAQKKIKTPLFDHAKMAAILTSITLQPHDAQHL
jgi:dipeptidyl-peptidase 4